ncbi:unnamed protein product, partial [Ixodes pacificus]
MVDVFKLSCGNMALLQCQSVVVGALASLYAIATSLVASVDVSMRCGILVVSSSIITASSASLLLVLPPEPRQRVHSHRGSPRGRHHPGTTRLCQRGHFPVPRRPSMDFPSGVWAAGAPAACLDVRGLQEPRHARRALFRVVAHHLRHAYI